MTEEKDEYELMLILKNQGSGDPEGRWGAAGLDSDSVAVNDALGIIKWLMKNDPSVKPFKLVNTAGRKQCVGATAGKALWTEKEDLMLIKLVKKGMVGQRLSGYFPGRTHGAVKQHQLVLRERNLFDD